MKNQRGIVWAPVLIMISVVVVIGIAGYFGRRVFEGSPVGKMTNQYFKIESNYHTEHCQNISSQCFGLTAEDCVQNWIRQSKCLTDDYIDSHYSNFTATKGITHDTRFGEFTTYRVKFNVDINGEPICETNIGCSAEVYMGPYNQVSSYFGPLHEIPLNVRKNEANTIMKGSSYCRRATHLSFAAQDSYTSTTYFYNPLPSVNAPNPPTGNVGINLNPSWVANDTTPHEKPYQYGAECVVNVKTGELQLYVGSNPAI